MAQFKIPGLHCGGCARRVHAALRAVDDQAIVQIDIPGRLVVVESRLKQAELAAALTRAGYPPEYASAPAPK